MSGFDSIEDLINPQTSSDDGSPQGKFQKKQKEIKIKEIEKATKTQAAKLGLPYIDLFGFPVSPEAIILIPEELSRKIKALCFYYDGKNLRLACVNPGKEVEAELERLKNEYFVEAKLYLVSENSFDYAIETYKSVPRLKRLDPGLEISKESLEKFKDDIVNYKELNEKIKGLNISDTIIIILAAAIRLEASDVHIEAEESGIAVRFRIDGKLHELALIDRGKWKQIISRLKILAGVKININDKPQDGRFTIFFDSDKVEVRSSFLPTSYGESAVMRILDSRAVKLNFSDLGLRPEYLKILRREISKPNGLILTTGPTGSGKTTTLYAILNELKKDEIKILTLEDPIEYKLPGINQSQVDEKKGYTFASGLRSILRQDPNIIMLGEIRDKEAAEISIQSSLTGHLVLSTLHTNDASGVIPRLINIGIEPYLLTPSINLVMGQRLLRKLCPYCRVEHELEEKEREQVLKILAVISPKAKVEIPKPLPKIYKAGPGCSHCNYIGYYKRIGIFELFTLDSKIKQLAIEKAPAFKILKQAIENGMISMLQDGILKVLEGETSLSELYETVGDFDYIDELYDIVIYQTMGRGIKLDKEDMLKADALNNSLKDSLKLNESSASDLIKIILSMAINSKTGDVHIEPAEGDVKIRFRIDGVMHDAFELKKTNYLPLISQFKILAGFPSNLKRSSLDGRFRVDLIDEKERVDCRLSIIPGAHGETIVIRILPSTNISLSFDDLGINLINKNNLNQALKKTKGIIISTGPTGSGKTTTLYGLLNKLNKPDLKIITIEDPIEYQLEGLIQTQVDAEQGYTFASAMRSLLRQNPNIMMIGEIRDSETAKIAIEAALTGHLVLSTIHANSAAGAISRFTGLGIDRQLLANSLEFSIAQRLVRRLCEHCKIEHQPKQEDLARAKEILLDLDASIALPKELKFYSSSGCPKCNNIGYKGRVGIYESINISNEIQKLIQSNSSNDYDIEEQAKKEPFMSMAQDGVLKALNGETSLEELFRVI